MYKFHALFPNPIVQCNSIQPVARPSSICISYYLSLPFKILYSKLHQMNTFFLFEKWFD